MGEWVLMIEASALLLGFLHDDLIRHVLGLICQLDCRSQLRGLRYPFQLLIR